LGGVLLFVGRARADYSARLHRRLPAAEEAYRGIVNLTDELAIWVTGRTQRGSLSFYLGVILAVAMVVPLSIALTVPTPWPDQWVIADHPAQIVIGAIMIVGAIAAIRASKRFMAVLMVSVTGFGMVAIFALQGAPDLALTQLLVETIVLVAFVLALRALPKRLWVGISRIKLGRAVLATALALMTVYVAIGMMAARQEAPISLAFPDLAYHEATAQTLST
uniref:hydrogenase subunit MbhD domain-containing protein n=1 Tax=Arthrobacter sp. JCM 19049 TaxID=1460643 RepID=UPI000A8737E0